MTEFEALKLRETSCPPSSCSTSNYPPWRDAVARALRRIEALRDTPIVAVTSYAMVGDREKCLAAGCNGYIEKPIDPQTFVSEIERSVNFH